MHSYSNAQSQSKPSCRCIHRQQVDRNSQDIELSTSPARNRGNLARLYFRFPTNERKERHFLHGLKARVSVPNI